VEKKKSEINQGGVLLKIRWDEWEHSIVLGGRRILENGARVFGVDGPLGEME